VSRLSSLLGQVAAKDPELAADLQHEVEALSARRAFGLNFERHIPETVELPGRRVRKGDKVRFLPKRGEAASSVDRRLWWVTRIRGTDADVVADLVRQDGPEGERQATSRAVEDLVVVAEFRDPIYPGLASTGKVERGGDKPFHTVINAENFHALQALLYTHEAKIDVIYIDPPYNTGARDWKYNNDYVDSDDAYRHSKWLAMMERRLKLARRLLNPVDSVLIVTIDEKEYLRLGLLLEQTFPGCRVQMVSATVSPRSTSRANEFSRVDEYLFFVFVGSAGIEPRASDGVDEEVRWFYLRRTQRTLVRGSRKNQFYPVYVDRNTSRIVKIGEPLGLEDRLEDVPAVPGAVPVFPINADGTELIWGLTGPRLKEVLDSGYVRVTEGTEHQPYTISYMSLPNIKKAERGDYKIIGTRPDGSKIVTIPGGQRERPTTVWREARHDAGAYGTSLLRSLIPNRRFPFPKSLYAVEDTLRIVVGSKPTAVVLDFFSGSGTTAHAVMRLNKQDGGRRQSISVTNNEVSGDEQVALRDRRLRPGDAEWEAVGICEYITKPRMKAAVTGTKLDGQPIEGDYKFRDEFPMADGFEENVEFFTMTYEAPRPVAHNRAFEAIAPLLWLKAGSLGRRIGKAKDEFDLADTYGVLFDLDASREFLAAVAQAELVRVAFIVTDDDRGFQTVCDELPARVEGVRLYESYLTNFVINTGRE
jgi:adenine-specific DNA-methyltransferase